MQNNMKVQILAGFLLCLLMTSCAPGEVRSQTYAMVVSGALERDLSGGEIYYEDIPGGRQIYIQKNGPGDAICVLTFHFPADLPPGNYTVSAGGSVAAAYFEAVDGVSRRYDTNISGVLTVEENGNFFRGNLDITAGEPAIAIRGSINGVPSANAPAANETEIQAANPSNEKAIIAVAILLIIVMALTSLAFQFYVGQQIYLGHPLSMLLMLNPTRVYLRGWRDPRLRRVMNGWTMIILGMLMFTCLFAVAYELVK